MMGDTPGLNGEGYALTAIGRLVRSLGGSIAFCCLFATGVTASENPGVGTVTVPPGKEVVIGVGTLLSEEDSPVGRTLLDGVEAYLQDHPSLMGHPVKMVAKEDGCDEATTLRRAREFCAMVPRPVAVIGYLCSAGSVASLKVHEACGVPVINVTSADPALTRSPRPWAIRLWVSRDRQGLLAGQWVRSKSVRRVVVIHEGDPTSSAIVDAFQGELAKFTPRPRVQAALVIEMERHTKALFPEKDPPQIVYYVGDGWALEEIWRTLPTPALSVPWVLDGRTEVMTSVDRPTKYPKELYRVLLDLPTGDPASPHHQYFRGRFGEPGIYTLVAYDAVAVLMDAFHRAAKQERGGTSWEPRALAEALRETRIHGLTGPIAFDERGDRIHAAGTIGRWRGDRWEAHWQGKLP